MSNTYNILGTGKFTVSCKAATFCIKYMHCLFYIYMTV